MRIPLLVKDLNNTPGNSEPYYFRKIGGHHFFTAQNEDKSSELWRSDGTESGTQQCTGFSKPSPIHAAHPALLQRIDNYVYFLASTEETGRELWRCDDSPTPQCLTDLDLPYTTALHQDSLLTQDTLLFNALDASGAVHWHALNLKTHETTSTSEPPKQTNSPQQATEIKLANATLYPKWDIAFGTELWARDNKGAEVLVKDIAPGPASASPTQLLVYDGQCYFVAYGAFGRQEVWRSDGTQQGTVPVTEFGTDQMKIYTFQNGVLLLRKFGHKGRIDIVTPNEDQVLISSKWQDEHGNIQDMITLNNSVFFTMNHPRYGLELWHKACSPLERNHLVLRNN